MRTLAILLTAFILDLRATRLPIKNQTCTNFGHDNLYDDLELCVRELQLVMCCHRHPPAGHTYHEPKRWRRQFLCHQIMHIPLALISSCHVR